MPNSRDAQLKPHNILYGLTDDKDETVDSESPRERDSGFDQRVASDSCMIENCSEDANCIASKHIKKFELRRKCKPSQN